MSDVPPPIAPLITKVDRHECGCVVSHLADGRNLVEPCPPCGLNDVAALLVQAGQALAAVSRSLIKGPPKAVQASPLRKLPT